MMYFRLMFCEQFPSATEIACTIPYFRIWRILDQIVAHAEQGNASFGLDLYI